MNIISAIETIATKILHRRKLAKPKMRLENLSLCPVCRAFVRRFLPGPTGGAGRNLCPTCNTEFVVTWTTPDTAIFWQTLGPIDPGRAARTYGTTTEETKQT